MHVRPEQNLGLTQADANTATLLSWQNAIYQPVWVRPPET